MLRSKTFEEAVIRSRSWLAYHINLDTLGFLLASLQHKPHQCSYIILGGWYSYYH